MGERSMLSARHLIVYANLNQISLKAVVISTAPTYLSAGNAVRSSHETPSYTTLRKRPSRTVVLSLACGLNHRR